MRISVFEFAGERGKWAANLLDPRAGRKRRRLLFPELEGEAGYVSPSRRTKTMARQRAEELLARWQAEADEASRRADGELTLEDFIALANRDPGVPRIGDELSPGTKKRRAGVLDQFARFVEQLPVTRQGRQVHFGNGLARDIEPWMLDRFVESRREAGVKRGLSRELSVLRRAFGHAIERKYLPPDSNPVPRIRQRRDPHSERESRQSCAFTPEELEVVLRHSREPLVEECIVRRKTSNEAYKIRQPYDSPAYFYALFVVAAETGLRPGELYGLRWTDVRFEESMLEVRPETSKTFGRWVPLHPTAEAVLRALRSNAATVHVFSHNGRPLDRGENEKLIRRYFRRLARVYPHLRDVSRRSMKSFRHYFAFQRANHWPVNKLQKVLGHTDIRTTAIYLKTDTLSLRDEFRSLPSASFGAHGSAQFGS